MKNPTAEDFDHAHDLRKNWQGEQPMTSQQRADIMLAEWQEKREERKNENR